MGTNCVHLHADFCPFYNDDVIKHTQNFFVKREDVYFTFFLILRPSTEIFSTLDLLRGSFLGWFAA